MEATREDASPERIAAVVGRELIEALRFPTMGRLASALLDGTSDVVEAIRRIEASHVARPVLEPSRDRPDLRGWFSEPSSQFDPELGAVSVQLEEDAEDAEPIVHDAEGRVIHRRVGPREKWWRGGSSR